MTFKPDFTLGNFIPEQIDLPVDFDQFREELKRILEDQVRILNRKDTGQYEEIETPINQTFPGATLQTKNRIFRKIINTGGLPNASTKIIPHGVSGINNNWFFTRIYGTAREVGAVGNRPFFIPLPNAAPSFSVEIMIDNTNVNITTLANLTTFTSSFVILEFYKG